MSRFHEEPPLGIEPRPLDRIRKGKLTHADLLTYTLLVYLRRRYDPDGNGNFFVTKKELREVTGILQAPQSVQRLNKGFRFMDGTALFDRDRSFKGTAGP